MNDGLSRDAVIFDMDGILVDTEPLQFRAAERVFREQIGLTITQEEMLPFVGVRNIEAWESLRQLYSLPGTAQELSEAQSRFYEPLLRDEAEIMEGAPELVAQVAAMGYAVAIASSSPRWQVDIVVDRLGLVPLLDAVASGEEVRLGKPAPEIYLLAADRLHVSPSRCVAVEDSQAGTAAARAAGMHVIAVPNASTATQSFAHANVIRSSLVGAAADIARLLQSRPAARSC